MGLLKINIINGHEYADIIVEEDLDFYNSIRLVIDRDKI